jgi:hypothetical protein
MNARSLALAAGLCLAATQASASIVDAFTVSPNPIDAGSTALLDLSLNLNPDPGYFNAMFTGVGDVSLSSGNGGTASIGLTSGTTSQDIKESFVYLLAGNYSPSYSATVGYSEQHTVYEQTGSYWVPTGYWYYYEYPCGFLSYCDGSYWVSTGGYYQPTYSYVTETVYQTFEDEGSLDLVVNDVSPGNGPGETPLPASLPLLGTGLGALALFASSRKSKKSVAAA